MAIPLLIGAGIAGAGLLANLFGKKKGSYDTGPRQYYGDNPQFAAQEAARLQGLRTAATNTGQQYARQYADSGQAGGSESFDARMAQAGQQANALGFRATQGYGGSPEQQAAALQGEQAAAAIASQRAGMRGPLSAAGSSYRATAEAQRGIGAQAALAHGQAQDARLQAAFAANSGLANQQQQAQLARLGGASQAELGFGGLGQRYEQMGQHGYDVNSTLAEEYQRRLDNEARAEAGAPTIGDSLMGAGTGIASAGLMGGGGPKSDERIKYDVKNAGPKLHSPIELKKDPKLESAIAQGERNELGAQSGEALMRMLRKEQMPAQSTLAHEFRNQYLTQGPPQYSNQPAPAPMGSQAWADQAAGDPDSAVLDRILGKAAAQSQTLEAQGFGNSDNAVSGKMAPNAGLFNVRLPDAVVNPKQPEAPAAAPQAQAAVPSGAVEDNANTDQAWGKALANFSQQKQAADAAYAAGLTAPIQGGSLDFTRGGFVPSDMRLKNAIRPSAPKLHSPAGLKKEIKQEGGQKSAAQMKQEIDALFAPYMAKNTPAKAPTQMAPVDITGEAPAAPPPTLDELYDQAQASAVNEAGKTQNGAGPWYTTGITDAHAVVPQGWGEGGTKDPYIQQGMYLRPKLDEGDAMDEAGNVVKGGGYEVVNSPQQMQQVQAAMRQFKLPNLTSDTDAKEQKVLEKGRLEGAKMAAGLPFLQALPLMPAAVGGLQTAVNLAGPKKMAAEGQMAAPQRAPATERAATGGAYVPVANPQTGQLENKFVPGASYDFIPHPVPTAANPSPEEEAKRKALASLPALPPWMMGQ